MQILTVPCKLDPTPEDRSALAATVGAFGAACRTVVRDTPAGLTNEARLRAEVYRAVRTRHGLSANLAQGAIARVAANRKAARATRGIVAIYRDASVQYDERTFRLFGEVVRLTLNGGRRRIALALGAHQRAQRARHGGERRIRSAQRGEVYSQAPPPAVFVDRPQDAQRGDGRAQRADSGREQDGAAREEQDRAKVEAESGLVGPIA